MTLVCRPVGRGNWHPVCVTFCTHADFFAFRVGQRFTLGTITYRIAEINP
jgi:hypothetical protein